LDTFERLESEVRGYIRSWPAVFTSARASRLWDVDGKEYIDFFSGAGVLNYGHNEPHLKQALLDYLSQDNIVHSLDMATDAKARFLETFNDEILKPRGMDYKVQFPGPTGTNAVEAALKLARKVKERDSIIGFTNAFHGMTLGSLSVTGNEMKRRGAGIPLHNATSMPYEGFLGNDVDTIDYLDAYFQADGSGVETPAAVIVETVQAEGGINTASMEWLQSLARLCKEHDTLLIVDDIQAGCGRTGPFFSFERAGIEPDIVCLSKSLSGYGLPMAVTLLKPELDEWSPGEHNGTFRGHNPAFVTATEAINRYWRDDELSKDVERKGEKIATCLEEIAATYPRVGGEVRGRGMLRGLFGDVDGLASEVSRAAFERGLIMETSGPQSEVAKVMPPLTVDDVTLDAGLDILCESFAEVAEKRGLTRDLAVAAAGA